MKLALPPFRTLGRKLTALYVALFAVALLIVAAVAQVMILNHARNSVRNELATSSAVFDRIWALRSRALGDSADVLARDFGFREAVASGDQPTMVSALANLRTRAGAGRAFIVTTDGQVLGEGGQALRNSMADLPYKLASGQKDAVIVSGDQVYRVVVSPVLAPMEIGWIVFAVALDDKEMQALDRLSAIPLTATILRRDPAGRWQATTGGRALAGTPLDPIVNDALADANAPPGTIDAPAGSAIALVKRLPSIDERPAAVLMLSYPLAKAISPYRGLQVGIVLAGVIGLLLVLIGSLRLARGIAGPIAELDRAARALESGERARVSIASADEIGRLADSFNRMSAEIVERENRIAHLAFNDVLTGLPNRVLFREQVDAAARRAARTGGRMAALCLDLDGFQSVNDTLGHSVGDELLRTIAGILSEIAQDALVARLWGDEFAILIADHDDPDRPRALAQAIVDRLRDPLHVQGHHIVAGTSIGIVFAPDDGIDADTLLKNADLALYRAKQDGRGIFRFFEPALDEAAQTRRQIELDLREALAGGQLSLDFQPIYNLKSNAISGFEALLRWRHPTRGLVSPVEFIPVAEDTGLIIQIGEWVIHEACRQAAGWPGALRVAVNVSPLQFANPGLSNVIFQALSRSGLEPCRLEIEITETVFLDGAGPTIDLLHRLRALGIRIALDDFGTGYSSLSYLRSFPFDKIKIDRSFVTPVAQDSGAAAIVHAIIDLASALNMETTAEGVEDEAQLAELRDQGCTTVQGFLMSRPIGAGDVQRLLEEDVRRVA